jgi:Trk K+ transport system NAD-binding subunit
MVILAAENHDGDPIVPGPDMNISPGQSMIIITTPDHTETIRRRFGAESRR